jgi:AraC-like DNA-binding protein
MRQIDLIGYRPAAGFAQQVEARRIAAEGPTPTAFHRIDFHAVVIARGGTARLTVDFLPVHLAPRSLVWVRPGQVYRWEEAAGLRATLLLFPPGLLDPAAEAAARTGGSAWRLPTDAWPDVVGLADLLERSHGPRVGTPSDRLRRAGARHALSALAFRLLREPTEGVDATAAEAIPGSVEEFRTAVDARFATEHRVSSYARDLGYSTRTLSRLTRDALGCSPKRVIDDRILLEARRLLTHTSQSVAAIARSLGFEDASNFATWFAVRSGSGPAAFRRDVGIPAGEPRRLGTP